MARAPASELFQKKTRARAQRTAGCSWLPVLPAVPDGTPDPMTPPPLPAAQEEVTMPSRRRLRWLRWLLAATAAVVVLAVGGTFVYIHFIEGPAPAPLSLGSATASPTASQASPAGQTGTTAASLAGTWQVATGSQAGDRGKEVRL